jgi:Peroxisomal biogenesis factor 11 (PEX11)
MVLRSFKVLEANQTFGNPDLAMSLGQLNGEVSPSKPRILSHLKSVNGICHQRNQSSLILIDSTSPHTKLVKKMVRSVDDDDDAWMVSTSSSSSSSSSSNYSRDEVDGSDDESDLEFALLDGETTSCWENESTQQPQQQLLNIEDDLRLEHHSQPNKQINISKIKDWLALYADFVSKTGNQEILLKLLQWSLWLLGAFTATILSNQEFRNVPHWITKISYDICYARYVTRLLGLPVALEGAMSGSWASSSFTKNENFDRKYQTIGHILAYSMVAYYPAEHVAFFLWMNPNAESFLNLSAEVWFYISMRCWLVYLLAESAQCMIKYYELRQHKVSMQKSKKDDIYYSQQCSKNTLDFKPNRTDLSNGENNDNTTIDITPIELNDEIYNIIMLLVRNTFYLLPCIHWSMSSWDTNPWLPDLMVNGLMWSEAVLCLYQAIRNS